MSASSKDIEDAMDSLLFHEDHTFSRKVGFKVFEFYREFIFSLYPAASLHDFEGKISRSSSFVGDV